LQFEEFLILIKILIKKIFLKILKKLNKLIIIIKILI